jgi:ring-1,2-phenylacetyl-CoA epoxidase subunit PaaE
VFYRLRVAAVERLCADAVAVTFAVPPELRAVFDFRAGQALTVRRTSDNTLNGTPQGAGNGAPQGAGNGAPQSAENGTPQSAGNGAPQSAENDTIQSAENGAQNGTIQSSENGTGQSAENGTGQSAENGTSRSAEEGAKREAGTIAGGGGLDERRTYSICSAVGEWPRIGVREVPGGRVSSWLVREVRAGDLVEVAPPTGSFTPDVAAGGRHVLIAAGSGITPVLSIAASLLREGDATVAVLYGNRRADTVMFAEELSDLKDRYPARLELAYLMSREAREPALFSGRMDAPKLKTLLPLMLDVEAVDHWWLCGPYAMVVDAAEVLVSFGVPAGSVHRELFWVDEPPPAVVTENDPMGDRVVTVVMEGRASEVPVVPGATVLDGVQRVRPDLPFACKGGVCGTCRAKVTSGEVTMRRNFALEEAELAAGYVLTCQAVTVSDRVTVDYDA